MCEDREVSIIGSLYYSSRKSANDMRLIDKQIEKKYGSI